MSILRILGVDGKPYRTCSIVAFDISETNKTFYFKQRVDDEEWQRVHYRRCNLYTHSTPYPTIDVEPEPVGKMEEKEDD